MLPSVLEGNLVLCDFFPFLSGTVVYKHWQNVLNRKVCQYLSINPYQSKKKILLGVGAGMVRFFSLSFFVKKRKRLYF
jgi:hypothetical protein